MNNNEIKYSKRKIGEELKRELDKGYNVIRISRWAYDLFSYNREGFSPEISEILQLILFMDGGPEFEYSEQELKLLARMLIDEEKDIIQRFHEKRKMNNLEWIQDWFYLQCNGDWEHGKGVLVGTLSNPGWYIKIDLSETELEDKDFQKIFVERSEQDWFFCDKQDGFFEGNCGPFNLQEMLQIFRDWAEANKSCF